MQPSSPAMQGRPASDTRSAKRDWWWIFDPRCSLRARAALYLGGGLLAFTFLLSWVTATLFRRTLEHHLAHTFETLAFQVGDKLDRAVYERYRMLQTAASLATLRDSAASIADRRRVLDVLQESSPEFAWIGLGHIGRAIRQFHFSLLSSDGGPADKCISGSVHPNRACGPRRGTGH